MVQAMGEFINKRRNGVRRRVLKSAKIVLKNRLAVFDCTVSNLSEGGACIKMDNVLGIPDSFDLVLGSGLVRDCRVAWRKLARMGVEFL